MKAEGQYCNTMQLAAMYVTIYSSKQQFGSTATRTSSHGISFSSRIGHRGMQAGSHSKMTAASSSRWNVTVDSKQDKLHHKPPVQVSFKF